MTTYTIFAGTADNGLECYSPSSYPTARAGTGNYLQSDYYGTGGFYVGQLKDAFDEFYVDLGFIAHDTSVVVDAPVISAVLSLNMSFDYSATDLNVQARLSDWGTSVTTGDWVAGASQSGLTLLASLPTSGIGSAGYKDFTDVAMVANLNLSGETRILLASDRTAAGNEPTGSEYLSFYSADASGTSQDPKLVVEAGAAGGSFPPFNPAPMIYHLTR